MLEEITASLSGTIISVNVKQGQKVKKNEEAMTMEAMKTENPLLVPCDGIVKSLSVKEGDMVYIDDVLAVIES